MYNLQNLQVAPQHYIATEEEVEMDDLNHDKKEPNANVAPIANNIQNSPEKKIGLNDKMKKL